MKRWSRKHDACIECGQTKRPHLALGYCDRCYLEQWKAKPGNRDLFRGYARNYSRKVGATVRNVTHFSGNRHEVLNRDGFRCRHCGKQTSLVVHHVDGTGRGTPVQSKNNHPSNLLTLCRSCHARVHQSENQWSRKHARCIQCSRSDVKHRGFGLCVNCYSMRRYWERRASVRKLS